jgi:hypothetical protein
LHQTLKTLLPNQNQHGNVATWFSFKKNLMTFSFLKVIKYSLFIFIFHIRAKFQTKKIWMFSITVSHFERITWIFVYDGCHNQFWKK